MRPWALALLLLSCGYRFTAPNSALPKGVRSARVAMLQNRTAEPNAEALLTQALREQLDRSGLLGGDGADAVLTGVVVGVSNGPVLASAFRPAFPTYRLNVTVHLTLEQGGVALAQAVFTEAEDYPSGPDVLLTEANRAAALHRVAETVARTAAERLSTGW
jgi:hypothetical protein